MSTTNNLFTIWKNEVRTLANAYSIRPPTTYIVEGLFPVSSVSIVYGPGGTMKSLILQDLSLCIATGNEWLQPLPHNKDKAKTFKVKKSPVLWLDFDNGSWRTDNRFEAFGRTYKAKVSDNNLFYISVPSIPFDITKVSNVMDVVDFIKSIAAKFVVIDNLLTISGGKDENASEIGQAMINLRLVAERTGAAIVVIHHSRKEIGRAGGFGDDLRGHSSIRGGIDLAFRVAREEGSDIITIKSTKTRDMDIEPFSAMWTYTHKVNAAPDLETAKFWGEPVVGPVTSNDIKNAIIDAIKQTGAPMNQTEIIKAVKQAGVKAGRDAIRTQVNRLHQNMILKTHTGARGAIYYEL